MKKNHPPGSGTSLQRLAQIVVALAPLALTPAVLWLLAEFGGSEKDILWVLPWTVWSAAFGGTGLVLVRHRWPWGRLLRRAWVVATAVVVVVGIVLALAGQLGIAGRF